MRITAIDPSMAVAFYCGTEEEFESLCQHIQRILIDNEKHPLFEVGAAGVTAGLGGCSWGNGGPGLVQLG